MSISFYHGGVNSDFTVDSVDVLRTAVKQQNKNNSYVGFYMYGEENRDGAFKYAESGNKNVVKLNMEDDLKIFEVPPFSITRITGEQVERLQSLGYDLIGGKMLGKMEYVLLNKNKIQSFEILSMNDRYRDSDVQQSDNVGRSR